MTQRIASKKIEESQIRQQKAQRGRKAVKNDERSENMPPYIAYTPFKGLYRAPAADQLANIVPPASPQVMAVQWGKSHGFWTDA